MLSGEGRVEAALALGDLGSERLEGKTWKEAMRCLKRQLADVVYRAMLEDSRSEALTT